ncbi:hypothetical protein [Microbispora triticiradicis]|uniref:hypothetical protein n=1 Tax=Microbispora triticiradicis TaxID=2200763 RepID=UPI001AD61EAE|nr:hypothetical protein [Microbispora triticiradicis]MBO4271335.1 hypothetical protein [Microbispora triticiradicis]
MTDPIVCPQCHGRCGTRYGRLHLACTFCGGRGVVGGDHEPAEPPPPPERPPPALQQRGWSLLATVVPCPYCFGSGRVPHVDQQSRTLTSLPCTEC